MRKIYLLLVLFLVSTLPLAYAAPCAGQRVYSTLEGKPVLIQATSNFNAPANSNDIIWRIRPFRSGSLGGQNFDRSVLYPDEESAVGLFQSPFERVDSCSVIFKSFKSGHYLLEVTNLLDNSTDELLVKVDDRLETQNYGHYCYELDTSSCGDITAYGDVSALEDISTRDLISYGNIHSSGYFEISPSVYIGSNDVRLPRTSITGNLTSDNLILSDSSTITNPNPGSPVVIDDDLSVDGDIYGGSDNIINIINNVEIGSVGTPRSLNVYGPSNLYDVDSISNNGNPIVVQGELSIHGDLTMEGSSGITLGDEFRNNWGEYESVGIENLIKNPGFEAGWDSWTDQVSGSSFVGPINSNERHGANSMRLVTTGNNQGVSQVINNLVTTRQYALSGWVYIDSGSPVVQIDGHEQIITGTGWQRINLTFTPSASQVTVYLGRTNSGSDGDYYFDDIQLEEGKTFNKFKPRYLDFQGNAEFNDVDALGDLYTEGLLTASNGLSVLSGLFVQGQVDVTGSLSASAVDVSGDIVSSSPSGRLMGSVNLRDSCASAAPKMFSENGDFIIELGSPGSCATGQACLIDGDCSSNICNSGICG